MSELDDLRAQLAERTAERDEARRVARELARPRPMTDHNPETKEVYPVCPFCFHRLENDDSRYRVGHRDDCPIMVVAGWPVPTA